jgi:hypothetical protein
MKKHIALGLVASTLFLAGCCTSHKTANLEYMTHTVFLPPDVVNANAKDGWKYDSAWISSSDPSGVHILYKRQAQ